MSSGARLTVVQGGKLKRDDELEELVAGIWEDIVKHIRDVLQGDSQGYENFLELADPSIEEVIARITRVDDLMNKMLDGLVAGDLPIEAELKLIDCQQCIHLIRRVHVALKHDNQHEYDDVIRKLKGHAGGHH
jgi:hypothetical protein